MMKRQLFLNGVKARFVLRDPKSALPTAIMMVVRLAGSQFKFATGVRVFPSQWDAASHRAAVAGVSPLDRENNIIANNRIKAMLKVMDNFRQTIVDAPDGVPQLHARLKSMLRCDKCAFNPVEWLKRAIDSDPNISHAPGRRHSTRTQYMNELKRLECFCKDEVMEPSDFDDFNTSFFDRYRDFLCHRHGPSGRPLTRNYVNSIMVNLRAMLRRAVEAGVMSHMAWKNIVLNKLRSKGQRPGVFLREDEILSLYHQPCPTATMELARDIFLLECLTGQRIGDTLTLGSRETAYTACDRLTVVNVLQQKTGEVIKVDMMWQLGCELLDKWRARGCPTLSDGYINRLVKRVARMAGINEPVKWLVHFAQDPDPIAVTRPKWQCITTHTGRRSFVSNLTIRGVSYELIAKYTGHRSVEMVRRYDMSTLADIAIFRDNLAHHPECTLAMRDVH